jgi:hypothetical protein
MATKSSLNVSSLSSPALADGIVLQQARWLREVVANYVEALEAGDATAHQVERVGRMYRAYLAVKADGDTKQRTIVRVLNAARTLKREGTGNRTMAMARAYACGALDSISDRQFEQAVDADDLLSAGQDLLAAAGFRVSRATVHRLAHPRRRPMQPETTHYEEGKSNGCPHEEGTARGGSFAGSSIRSR